MYIRQVSLLLLVTCGYVYGQFETGATAAECVTLQPSGSTASSATTPFIVAVTSSSYTPGGSAVQVFIASASTVVATGLVVQARRTSSNADESAFGSFALPSGGNYRLLQCGSSAAGTITNTNNSTKNLPLSFMWTPPAENVGSVEFIVSLTRNDGEFFSNVVSTAALSSTEGELTVLSIDTCPVPFVNGNNVGTWTNPDCFRGNEVLANSATCEPPSGSTFSVGENAVICTCSDRGETATCDITITIEATDPCNPNPCENGGTCINIPGLDSGFVCQCPAGFPQPTCTLTETPPNTPNCPPNGVNVVAPAGSNAVQVTYNAVQCVDAQDGTIQAVCDRPSTTFFPIATTPVTCTCTDSASQTSSCTFNVVVSPIDGVCANNPCLGNECRVSDNSLAGYTCHSVTGTPCVQ